jgi:hypothetical protein
MARDLRNDEWPATAGLPVFATPADVAVAESLRRGLEARLLPRAELAKAQPFGAQHCLWVDAYEG